MDQARNHRAIIVYSKGSSAVDPVTLSEGWTPVLRAKRYANVFLSTGIGDSGESNKSMYSFKNELRSMLRSA